jgi:hypothetical protein
MVDFAQSHSVSSQVLLSLHNCETPSSSLPHGHDKKLLSRMFRLLNLLPRVSWWFLDWAKNARNSFDWPSWDTIMTFGSPAYPLSPIPLAPSLNSLLWSAFVAKYRYVQSHVSLGSSGLQPWKIVISWSEAGNGPLFHAIAVWCIAIVNSNFNPELLLSLPTQLCPEQAPLLPYPW